MKRFPGCAFTTTANQRTCAFNHAPHIRARGGLRLLSRRLTKRTTAERKIDLNMGFCLNCHTQKKVSIDCETCPPTLKYPLFFWNGEDFIKISALSGVDGQRC